MKTGSSSLPTYQFHIDLSAVFLDFLFNMFLAHLHLKTVLRVNHAPVTNYPLYMVLIVWIDSIM
jgi:hypothetical protein